MLTLNYFRKETRQVLSEPHREASHEEVQLPAQDLSKDSLAAVQLLCPGYLRGRGREN